MIHTQFDYRAHGAYRGEDLDRVSLSVRVSVVQQSSSLLIIGLLINFSNWVGFGDLRQGHRRQDGHDCNQA
jgi:hypothetical protein